MDDKKKSIINYSKSLKIDKIGFARYEILNKEAEISKESYYNLYFANKNYLYNNIEIKRNPRLILENTNSVIAIAINYNTPFSHNIDDFGKISKHSWGYDYHYIVKYLANEIANYIKNVFNEQCFVSVDGGKVFEKIWAEKCGIGWQGKNSLIITPEYGSWIFLGIILTSLKIEPDIPITNKCANCKKCVANCPNNAIVKEKIIDLRKCISFLTIEDKKNEYLNANVSFANYLYGCDICQNVCPFNCKNQITNFREFYPLSDELTTHPEKIKKMNKEEFNKTFNNTSIKRVGLNKLKANSDFLLNSLK